MLLRKKLVLHVGSHKTGTTSIQAALRENRDALKQQGVCYPFGIAPFEKSPVPHHQFAHALVNEQPLDHLHVTAFMAAVQNDARDCHTVIISSEPIYRHVDGLKVEGGLADKEGYWPARRAYLQRLARLLTPYDVRVLVYFREPAAFATSLYRHRLRSGPIAGGRNSFMRCHSKHFVYAAQLAALREVFSRVDVRQYEAAAGTGLVDTFFSEIGVAPPQRGAATRTNVAPTKQPLFRSDAERRAFLAAHKEDVALWASLTKGADAA